MGRKRNHYPLRSIFISYNHRHASDIAGRVYDRLAARLSPGAVFKDNEEPELGVDFLDSFKHALNECRIVLVVIDPGWYERRNAPQPLGEGIPPDWVRMEVEYALQKAGLRVIPVLVNGAEPPDGQPLPPSLAGLRRRYHKRIHSDDGFNASVEALIVAIERALVPPKSKSTWRKFLVPAVASLALLTGLATWGFFYQANSNTGSDDDFKVRIQTLDGIPINPSRAVLGYRRPVPLASTADDENGTGKSVSCMLDLTGTGAAVPGPVSLRYYVAAAPASRAVSRPGEFALDPKLISDGTFEKVTEPYWMDQGYTYRSDETIIDTSVGEVPSSNGIPHRFQLNIDCGAGGQFSSGLRVFGLEVIGGDGATILYRGEIKLDVWETAPHEEKLQWLVESGVDGVPCAWGKSPETPGDANAKTDVHHPVRIKNVSKYPVLSIGQRFYFFARNPSLENSGASYIKYIDVMANEVFDVEKYSPPTGFNGVNHNDWKSLTLDPDQTSEVCHTTLSAGPGGKIPEGTNLIGVELFTGSEILCRRMYWIYVPPYGSAAALSPPSITHPPSDPAPQAPVAGIDSGNRIQVSSSNGTSIATTPIVVARNPGKQEWTDSTGQTHQSENFIVVPLHLESVSTAIPGPLWVNYYVNDSKPAGAPPQIEFAPSLTSGLSIVPSDRPFWGPRGFTRVGSWPLLQKPGDPSLPAASDKKPHKMSGAIIFGKEGHIDPGKHEIGIEVITPSPNFETLYQGTLTLDVK